MIQNKKAVARNGGLGEDKSFVFSVSFNSKKMIGFVAKARGMQSEIIATILVNIVMPLAVLWRRVFAKLILISVSLNLEIILKLELDRVKL